MENVHGGSTEVLLPLGNPENQSSKVSLLQLFRFTSKSDKVIMVIGFFFSIISGISMPLQSGVLGKLSQSFMNFTKQIGPLNSTDPERERIFNHFHDEISHCCLLLLFVAIAALVASTIQEYCFVIAGENTVDRLRKLFMKAIIRQDIAWFDSQKTGALTTELFNNLERMKEGICDNVGRGCEVLAMFFGGYAVCFYADWRLTLIGACFTPLMAFWGYFDEHRMAKIASEQEQMDAEAGAVCEQALTSIRTVMAFNGQEQECNRYKTTVNKVYASGIKYALNHSAMIAVTIWICFTSFGMTAWFGTNYLVDEKLSGGVVITIIFIIYLCIARLDRIAPVISRLNKARGAAEVLYTIVDRVPEIDSYSKEGQNPDVTGKIELRNVRFHYPSRPDLPVLKGIDITVEPEQTVALVGASGCGKSTIVQLLLRYYDPTHGRITIDGIDIDQFNIEHLRRTIGVVSQEPVLFNTTLEENIRYGNENISENEIWSVLKKANAFDFVKAFPDGLQTLVGDRGAQLSGGQKQRIAIARALVRNPKILLLDEATSALDNESERIVQSALEKASVGRTTIVIAHRLSTIQNADKIIAMRNGEVVEVGTHEDLLRKQGLYYELVNSQTFVDTADTPAHPHLHYRQSRSISSEGGPYDHGRMRSTMVGVYETLAEERSEDEDETARLKAVMEEEGASESTLWRIFKAARPEWGLLIFIFLFSIAEAIVFPLFSFCFSELVRVYSNKDKNYILENGHLFSILFVAVGTLFAFTQLAQLSLFGVVSERLTKRLRLKVFRNIMRMDAAYFDKPSHSAGKLLTRLATDANNIKPAINDRLGLVITEVFTDVLGISAAMYFGWQIAIVATPLFPMYYFVTALRGMYMNKRMLEDERNMETCGKIAMEAVENIRTVHALTLQTTLQSKFNHLLKAPLQTSRQKAIWQSVTYGVMNSAYMFIFSVTYRAGLYFIYHDVLEPQAVLRAIFILSFCSGSLGTLTDYYPDYVKAKMAAGLLFKMLDQEPKIDGMTEKGGKPEISGNIKVKGVHFKYPERDDVTVLNGLDLEINQGQTVALVGASGCGKSTLVSLVERLYDSTEGVLEIDGCDAKTINPHHLRSNISIVSQEPVLFDLSIKENILYGLEQGTISHTEMIEAAKKANIHDFVSILPEAYHTRVGEKGTQLSGGQKQRIAIARALVRNPKILILDEATSALDTESEKQVQQALEKAAAGRSCIIVAHRLSTIVNADVIAVFKDGKIVEKGTHEELMALNKIYWSLIQKQKKQ